MSGVNALRFRGTPSRSDRFEAPKRDESAMDIDSPGGSGSGYGYNDGPSRKRHHGENGPTPFAPSPFVARPAPMFNHHNNTPFLFSTSQPVAPQVPPMPPFSQYDPNTMRFDMGASGPPPSMRPATWVADIDMEDSSASAAASAGLAASESGGLVDAGQSDQSAGQTVQSGGQESEPTQPTVDDNKEGAIAGKRPIAKGAVSRVRKRRAKEWKRRHDTDTEGEEEYNRRSGSGNSGSSKRTIHHHHNLNAPGMRHSEVPALLLGYLQVFVNASIVLFVVYLAFMFVMAVRRDVQDRMAEASVDLDADDVELLQEISECTQLYLTNRCDPAVRVPAMESACKTWDMCMHRDPTMIGRTNVMAETFAGVINAFVEQISWKTMGFTLVTLSFMVTLANSALFNLRQSASVPIDASQAYYPPPQGHLGWQQAYTQPGQGMAMPSMIGTSAQGQGNTDMSAGMNADMGVRQIGWEEPKKKGWFR